MPRGNDTEAHRELDRQYGDHASAEDLIKAHERSVDLEMQNALQKPVDGAATEALDIDKIKPKYDGIVRSAAVRDGKLIVVEEVGADKRLVKWCDADHVKGNASARAAANQAAASVGGSPKREGGAPEGQGRAGATPLDSGSGALNDTGQTPPAAPAAPAPSADAAPDDVTVPVIRAKVDELKIDVPRDVRTKDRLWALLPADAQDELKKDAAPAA